MYTPHLENSDLMKPLPVKVSWSQSRVNFLGQEAMYTMDSQSKENSNAPKEKRKNKCPVYSGDAKLGPANIKQTPGTKA
ncbi:uncharacterized protein ACBT44_014783 isoform 2-T2 [Syngnathus typhle]